MFYHYIASDKNGQIIEGDIEGNNLDYVLQYLASKELRPISAKPMREGGEVNRLFGRITLTDKIFLTKYLALMLRVGTDLLSAINILIGDFDKQSVKNFLIEVRSNLSRGQPFYQAFAKYPRIFSPVFISLIKAAEASGNLQQTFEDLSVSLQKEAELRKRVRSAFIYPIILLVIGLAIFIFLSLFALPRIAKVFTDSGIRPPTFSRVVFAVGLFVGDHVTLLLTLLFAVIGGALYFFGKNEAGRRLASQIIVRLPVVRSVYRDLAIQRFAATFSALMKAGLPIIQATKITAEVVGSTEFRISLIRIADDGLAKGLTIGEAFRRESAFPRVVTNLVAISEKAGHLSEVLETLAEFYASSVDSSIRSLVAFVEPLLLLLMGILVGTIAMAIIVPIYQLTSQF